MAQMPMPIAVLPPISQTKRARPLVAVTRPARSRAAYDADTAIKTERATCRGSYDPVNAAFAEIITGDFLRWFRGAQQSP
jgi:hypothetical protein